MKWLLIALFVSFSPVFGQEWDAHNFPNPTAGQFKECKMRTTANICDPDGVLSEQARYRLDHDLKQLESRTRQDYGRSFCDKKGVTAAMAIARHVKGGSTEAVETMANDMLQRWTLDSQCKKAVVIVVSTDDMKFWVARDDKVPVYADEFTQIFMNQKSHFQQANYQQALSNILQETWEKALSKQGSPRQPTRTQGGGGGSGGSGGPGFGQGGGGGGRSGPAFKMPSIPKWFWLFLIGVIIPLLCCCCCLYCCCCRGRGGGQRVPTDGGGGGAPMGGGGGSRPQGGGGGGRSPFSNFLSTAGGAGVGSMLGRLLSGGGNRGGGGGMGGGGFGMGGMGGGGMGGNRGYGYNGAGGGAGGGGAYPDAPTYDDNGGQGGGGLYPSREVKDRGGGGSWA